MNSHPLSIQMIFWTIEVAFKFKILVAVLKNCASGVL